MEGSGQPFELTNPFGQKDYPVHEGKPFIYFNATGWRIVYKIQHEPLALQYGYQRCSFFLDFGILDSRI